MVKIAAGEYFRLMIEHKQAFGQKANNYINLCYRHENLPLNVYDGSQQTSLYHVNYNQFDFNYTRVFGTNWSLAAGIKQKRNTFSPEVTDNLKVDGSMNNYFAYLKSEAKTTERRLYPTSGYEFSAEAGMVFNREAQITIYNNDSKTIDTSDIINGKPEFYRFMASVGAIKPDYVLTVSWAEIRAKMG